MKKTLLVVTVCFSAALAVELAAQASSEQRAETGVTSNSILLGGTVPLSGVASAYASVARGADAYFKYVNSRGGVFGRKITYRYLDDEYDPGKTVQQTRRLVQQDKVFAIFNSLGTEHNLATRDFLNEVKVPQLFVASGASTFGRDYKQYPWTIGYQPSYVAEGKVYGRYIAKRMSQAKLGILFQNDDYGKDLIEGLRFGLHGKGRIVSQQGYEVTDPDVRSQIAKLKASGAKVFLIFATPKFALQGYRYAQQLGWKPKVFVNVVSSASNIMSLATQLSSKRTTEGTISIVFLKDPNDPQYAKTKGVRLYKQIMRRFAGGKNIKDVYNVYGMSVAFTMVDALKKAGKNLTRAGIMRAVTHLNERSNPFLLSKIVVKTSASDHFPIAQARLERYHNGRWIAFGPLVSVRK